VNRHRMWHLRSARVHSSHEKGKPAARRGRKATGLFYEEVAGPPKGTLWNAPNILVPSP
jgi:hypothetical protein